MLTKTTATVRMMLLGMLYKIRGLENLSIKPVTSPSQGYRFSLITLKKTPDNIFNGSIQRAIKLKA